MAVDYGLSLGFEQKSLILALLITQFTGFPAALLFGWIGSRFGPRAGIFLALLIYMVVTLYGAMMDSVKDFYLLAFAIGLAQGGIQALSRSLYARMIPRGHTAEFFGFYNMLGKFAAIVGPLLIKMLGNHNFAEIFGHPYNRFMTDQTGRAILADVQIYGR